MSSPAAERARKRRIQRAAQRPLMAQIDALETKLANLRDAAERVAGTSHLTTDTRRQALDALRAAAIEASK